MPFIDVFESERERIDFALIKPKRTFCWDFAYYVTDDELNEIMRIEREYVRLQAMLHEIRKRPVLDRELIEDLDGLSDDAIVDILSEVAIVRKNQGR